METSLLFFYRKQIFRILIHGSGYHLACGRRNGKTFLNMHVLASIYVTRVKLTAKTYILNNRYIIIYKTKLKFIIMSKADFHFFVSLFDNMIYPTRMVAYFWQLDIDNCIDTCSIQVLVLFDRINHHCLKFYFHICYLTYMYRWLTFRWFILTQPYFETLSIDEFIPLTYYLMT